MSFFKKKASAPSMDSSHHDLGFENSPPKDLKKSSSSKFFGKLGGLLKGSRELASVDDYLGPEIKSDEKKDVNYFGVTLTAIMRYEGEDKQIPRIIDGLVSHLKYEAMSDKQVFREECSVDDIDDFKMELNANLDRYYYLKITKYSNSLIAEVIIDFFCNLPHGLINGEVYNGFVQILNDQDVHKRSQVIVKEIEKMPKLNQLVLKKVIECLYCLANYGKVNELTSRYLAIKFVRCLFRHPKKDFVKEDPSARVLEAQILLHLIRHYPDIFSPSEMDRAQWRDLGSIKHEAWPLPHKEESQEVIFTEQDFVK